MANFERLVDVEAYFVHSDELPWVTDGDTTYRLMQVREDDNFVVTHFRRPGGIVGRLHRHLAPAIIYTISGSWGHRPETMDHRDSTYVYVPAGTVHRYYGGSAVDCLGLSFGDTEGVGEDGKPTGPPLTVHHQYVRYMQLCEEGGFARPNVLQ
jgi:hypothetical protein